MKEFRALSDKLWRLHKLRQKEILIIEKIDLNAFLDFTQQELNDARSWNKSNLINGRWDAEIQAREKVQEVIIELIGDQTKKNAEYSYTDYAMALSIKNIQITAKGIGVKDNIDYAQKFGLASPKALYNRLNNIIKEDIANPENFQQNAVAIIKKYSL